MCKVKTKSGLDLQTSRLWCRVPSHLELRGSQDPTFGSKTVKPKACKLRDTRWLALQHGQAAAIWHAGAKRHIGASGL
jgi:hypothetical protein